MRRILTALLALCLTALPVQAATVDDLVGLGMNSELAEYVAGMSTVLSNAEWIQATDQAGTGTINILKVDTADDTVLNADSGDLIKLSVAATPVAAFGAPTPAAAFTPQAAVDFILNGELIALDKVSATTLGITSQVTDIPYASNAAPRLAAYVPTLAATPAAGTNDFKIGFNVVPTAAANAAAIFPTPAANGQYLEVFNSGPNAVRLKAGGTNTINASAAGAYIPLATFQNAKCRSASTGAWVCAVDTVPTPAGP